MTSHHLSHISSYKNAYGFQYFLVVLFRVIPSYEMPLVFKLSMLESQSQISYKRGSKYLSLLRGK